MKFKMLFAIVSDMIFSVKLRVYALENKQE